MNLLFVCTGNTCRSPMAEEIAKKILSINEGVKVSSAGVYAFTGSAASENSLKVMEEIGLDLSNHMATMLDEKILNENDLILAMTKEHKEIIISEYPNFKDKVYTLGEYIDINEDVVDPFGGDIDIYRDCREQLSEYITKLSESIKKS